MSGCLPLLLHAQPPHCLTEIVSWDPLAHLEGPEQVDLNDTSKLVEQGTDLVLTCRAQHFGKEQLHTHDDRGPGVHKSAAAVCQLTLQGNEQAHMVLRQLCSSAHLHCKLTCTCDLGTLHLGTTWKPPPHRMDTSNCCVRTQVLYSTWQCLRCLRLLTILFSALLSSTALRFLICSSGSAHLTASGVVLPSNRSFSS